MSVCECICYCYSLSLFCLLSFSIGEKRITLPDCFSLIVLFSSIFRMNLFNYEYLGRDHLNGLNEYKVNRIWHLIDENFIKFSSQYNAVDTSPLSIYVMQPFWNRCVEVKRNKNVEFSRFSTFEMIDRWDEFNLKVMVVDDDEFDREFLLIDILIDTLSLFDQF